MKFFAQRRRQSPGSGHPQRLWPDDPRRRCEGAGRQRHQLPGAFARRRSPKCAIWRPRIRPISDAVEAGNQRVAQVGGRKARRSASMADAVGSGVAEFHPRATGKARRSSCSPWTSSIIAVELLRRPRTRQGERRRVHRPAAPIFSTIRASRSPTAPSRRGRQGAAGGPARYATLGRAFALALARLWIARGRSRCGDRRPHCARVGLGPSSLLFPWSSGPAALEVARAIELAGGRPESTDAAYAGSSRRRQQVTDRRPSCSPTRQEARPPARGHRRRQGRARRVATSSPRICGRPISW